MKFDQDLCLNLWYESTLGSVVPLAMFLRSMFHIKVHSACLEYLAPTDGTPGIGNGCQIKLAFKAAGDVNWRLGIQVDIGCPTP